MKKGKRLSLIILLVAGVMVFTFSQNVNGSPLYYTFEGSVTNIWDDSSGIIAASDLTIGSNISYTFLVDYDADGTSPDSGPNDYGNGDIKYFNYFYADYISGSKLQEIPDEDNTGVEITTFLYNVYYTVATYLLSGGGNNQMELRDLSSVPDWTVGSNIYTFSDRANNQNGSSWLESNNLTITSISDTLPVPEPSTIFLLGSGLVGMATWRKRPKG